MIIGYILLGFVVYFLYKFVVGFVLPIVRTASAMKRKVEEMKRPYQQNASSGRGPQEQVNSERASSGPADSGRTGFGRFRTGRPAGKSKTATGSEARPAKADYIDFEEIK